MIVTPVLGKAPHPKSSILNASLYGKRDSGIYTISLQMKVVCSNKNQNFKNTEILWYFFDRDRFGSR